MKSHELVVHFSATPLDGAHGVDPPRGDSPSSPVTRNVGQCGKHSPQATQAASSSSSSRRSSVTAATVWAQTAVHTGASGVATPVGETELRLRHRRRVGQPGAQAHQRGRDQAQLGERLRRRFARQRAAITGRELVVPPRWPPPPTDAQQHRVIPGRRARAQHVPVQQRGTIGGHHHVAGVNVAVAHHAFDALGPPGVSLDRINEAGPRSGVERGVDLRQPLLEVPPRKRLARRQRVSHGQRTRVDGVHLRKHSPDVAPVGLGVDGHQATPRRCGELAVGHDVVTGRERDAYPASNQQLRQVERPARSRGAGSAHPQHHVAALVQRAHAHAQELGRR